MKHIKHNDNKLRNDFKTIKHFLNLRPKIKH